MAIQFRIKTAKVLLQVTTMEAVKPMPTQDLTLHTAEILRISIEEIKILQPRLSSR